MAVSLRTPQRLQQRWLHHLGGYQRGVQADGSGRGGPAVGGAEVQAKHELRQTEQSSEVTREGNYAIAICRVPV